MLLLRALAFTALATATSAAVRDYDNRNYFLVELDTSQSNKPLQEFIADHPCTFEHELQGLDNHYVFSIGKDHPYNDFLGNYKSNNEHLLKRSEESGDIYDRLVNNSHLRSIHMLPEKQLKKRMPVMITGEERARAKRLEIVDSSQEPAKKVSDALDIQDPLFLEQWHLVNTKYPGHDVNVSGLWEEGITGKGVVTAVVDDGLDYENADLTANFNEKGSWDFNNPGNSPLPRLYDDYHGTRCAGEIAAVKNDVCGVGVAYDSQVAGIRILSGSITSADEAAALVYGLETNDIYSCSWGPTDDGMTLAEPDAIVKKAMLKGVQKGRADKGSVYVFASGNGGRRGDSCNFDGYTNSIYSITVGAIDFTGQHPTYAEACAAVMVVTYSSGSGEHIHTTDFKNKCTASHGGTSAAAPLAAGIYALVLQANPNLTWRDVQYVSVLSSSTINEDDGDYQKTALGKLYSHKYGYGKVDAYKMVHFAKEWKNVKPQAWFYSDVQEVVETIQSGKHVDRKVKILRTMNVTQDDLRVMNVERVEHVTVKVNVKAKRRGDVAMRIISPSGVVSDLATFRLKDTAMSGFKDWTFMSVAHWGEDGLGEWKLEVFGNNDVEETNEITLENWQLRFFGESREADKAEVYEMDKDYAMVRRDRLEAEKAEKTSSTTTAETSTSSEEQAVTTETQVSETSTSTEQGTSQTSSTSSQSSSAIEVSHPDTGVEEEVEEGKNKQYTTDHTGKYLIGFAIVGFVVVLLLMKFHKSPGSTRRRRRREEYEFDIIPGEDYSDSDEQDSFDLGHPRRSESSDEREIIYGDEQFMPNHLDGEEEMFSIGGDDDDDKKKSTKNDETKSDESSHGNSNEAAGERDGLLQS